MKAYSKKTDRKTPYTKGNTHNQAPTDEKHENIGNQATLKMINAAEKFNPNNGTKLTLPEELKTRMENSFGMSLSEVSLRESSQVRSMGTSAVARGNTISFAPGVYDPTTRIGRDIIGHEMAPVVQQASGKVSADLPGTGISLDQGLEHAADHAGSMAVMDTGSYMEAPQTVAPLAAVTAESAPMQGKNWLKSLWRYITGKSKAEQKTRERADTMIDGVPPVPETEADIPPPPVPEAEEDIPPPPVPEAEEDIPPPPVPEAEEDIPPPPVPEAEEDIPPPPVPEAEEDIPPPPPIPEAETTTAPNPANVPVAETTTAPNPANVSVAETTTAPTDQAANGAPQKAEKSVGLPTSIKVREIAGKYIKSGDKDFMNILNLLDVFHHTIDTMRLPAVPTQDADKAGFLQQLGDVNTVVMTTYNDALDGLMGYSTAHSNDKNKNKQTLATYAIQYYMIGHSEKIRTQSVYDAMLRAVSAESPTGGMADFNELAGKTFREAIDAMGVFVNRSQALKQMSGGMNTVDFVQVGDDANRIGVLKKGQSDVSLSAAESEALIYLQNNVAGDEAEERRVRALSFEELAAGGRYEFAAAVIKYRGLSRKELRKVIDAVGTTEEVYRKRLKETTNLAEGEAGDVSAAYNIQEANTAQRDVAVSRINKLLGFDIITETEFAQTEDRTKSSLAKKADGDQACRFLYYARSEDEGEMGLLSEIRAIYDFLKAQEQVTYNPSLKDADKEKALADISIAAPTRAIDLSRSENANQVIKLSIVDMIVGHVDRHAGNFMVQPGESGVMTMKGIDNDTAFGRFDDITGDEAEKADETRITPYLNDALPFVPRSIYESVNKVSADMIRGALTGLLSEEEIQFAESRFEKVKAHLAALAAANKIEDATEQNVTELAGRHSAGGNSQANYMGALLGMREGLEQDVSMSIKQSEFRRKGYTSLEELKNDLRMLKENGIDPIELVRTKRDFSKEIVRSALRGVLLTRPRSGTI